MKKRLVRLASQVEKLSWMLEYMEESQIEGIVAGCNGVTYISEAEEAWTERKYTTRVPL